MEHVTVADIVQAVGGRLLCGDPETPVRHISIDSRHMEGDDLFVPIIGARVDAHRFIEGAFAAGAVATFTSEEDAREDTRPWIRVEDTVRALQDLGAWYRQFLKMPVVGITGSVGKTTTREMVTAALSARLAVTGTTGNSNGQLGVPIMVCQADLSAGAAVLEMGVSEPGEMPRIARVARPDVAVVTNIGVSHIENLGSREGICREKMQITGNFGPENVAVLNGDEPLLAAYRGNTRFRTVFYGMGPENDYRAEQLRLEDGHTRFTAVTPQGSLEVSLQVPGQHNVMNALAALAAAGQLGIPAQEAAEKLAQYGGFARRLQIFPQNGVTIIDDSYNASPESMRAALQVLSDQRAEGRRAAVLADMKELGPDSPAFHRQVGEFAAQCPVDRFFLVGDLVRHLGEALEAAGKTVEYFPGNPEAAAAVKAWMLPGDVILFKGSNSMRLGEIIQEL